MVVLRNCQEAMVARLTPVGQLDAEKTVEAAFICVFRIAFTASLFSQ